MEHGKPSIRKDGAMTTKARIRPEGAYAVFHVQDPDKQAILRFFRATSYDIAAAGYLEDEMAGEETDIPECATVKDGFSWSNKDAYHFEKYDIELTPAFRDYAIAHAPSA